MSPASRFVDAYQYQDRKTGAWSAWAYATPELARFFGGDDGLSIRPATRRLTIPLDPEVLWWGELVVVTLVNREPPLTAAAAHLEPNLWLDTARYLAQVSDHRSTAPLRTATTPPAPPAPPPAMFTDRAVGYALPRIVSLDGSLVLGEMKLHTHARQPVTMQLRIGVDQPHVQHIMLLARGKDSTRPTP